MTRPYEQDDDLSTIVFGGLRSPGVVTLSGHDRAKNWDIQQAKGSTGANTTLNGDAPGQFEASFYLVDEQTFDDGTGEPTDFDLWDTFQRLIESTTNGPKPFALPIFHPDLARNGFTEVINAGVGGMVHDGKGGATVKVKFLEFKPRKVKKAATASAKGGSPAGPNAKPPAADPNAALKAELAGLLANTFPDKVLKKN